MRRRRGVRVVGRSILVVVLVVVELYRWGVLIPAEVDVAVDIDVRYMAMLYADVE